ncbi:hypothetical protein B0H13DRAFT_2453416 [Mycena leptocephala]|nr:hypothetical protein B0H13DRAFT_2453416 [Mycena leptocephala]
MNINEEQQQLQRRQHLAQHQHQQQHWHQSPSLQAPSYTPPPLHSPPPRASASPDYRLHCRRAPARPKTSHTTIERRYRTNLNARIQSLRHAVVDRAAALKAGSPSSPSSPSPASFLGAEEDIIGVRLRRRRKGHVQVLGGIQEGNGGNGNGGQEGNGGRWLEALCARTWWVVVVGDVLTADALGVPPHVAFGSLSSSPFSLSSPSMQQVQGEDDPLARGRDWVEEGDADQAGNGENGGGDGQERGGNGGKKFGGLVRLVHTLHAVHALPGLEGACRAEGAIRAWAEGKLSASSSTSNSSNSSYNANGNFNNAPNGAGFEFAPEFGSAYVSAMDVDSPSSAYPHEHGQGWQHDSRQQHEKARQEREREDAEVALLAHRAVLGTYNPNSPSSTSSSASASPPPQAVYGAVDAVHGIVQACKVLAAASSSSPSPTNSKATVLGKAVKYIAILKNREAGGGARGCTSRPRASGARRRTSEEEDGEEDGAGAGGGRKRKKPKVEVKANPEPAAALGPAPRRATSDDEHRLLALLVRPVPLLDARLTRLLWGAGMGLGTGVDEAARRVRSAFSPSSNSASASTWPNSMSTNANADATSASTRTPAPPQVLRPLNEGVANKRLHTVAARAFARTVVPTPSTSTSTPTSTAGEEREQEREEREMEETAEREYALASARALRGRVSALGACVGRGDVRRFECSLARVLVLVLVVFLGARPSGRRVGRVGKSEEGEGEGDTAADVDKLLRALVLYRRSPDVRFLAARRQKILLRAKIERA